MSGYSRHRVQCLAGGVMHGNGRIAARCRDCQEIAAQRRTPEYRAAEHHRQLIIIGVAAGAIVLFFLALAIPLALR